jgi:hypothetical protein
MALDQSKLTVSEASPDGFVLLSHCVAHVMRHGVNKWTLCIGSIQRDVGTGISVTHHLTAEDVFTLADALFSALARAAKEQEAEEAA